MPTSLTATKIKDTYGQLLHVDGGVTSTLKTVYDGDGTTTALKISTTAVEIPSFTLSGGIANGVVYLNGSKVATTGSALTFDGTALGIGVSNIRNDAPFVTGSNFYSSSSMAIGSTGGFLQLNSTSVHQFQISGSEQMRLTSTGLCIGTTSNLSSAFKLNIEGGRLGVASNSDKYGLYLRYNSSTSGIYLGSPSSDTLTISTNAGNEQMRLDSSGNLGLGVTPSALNAAGYRGFELGTSKGGGIVSSGLDTHITQNCYYEGSWRYANTQVASRYQVSNGHQWFVAPSGTAGNAISFTQAMTLDASGVLSVNITGSNSRIANFATSTFPSRGLRINTYTSNGGVDCGVNFDSGTGGYGGFTFSNSGTENMRIDSSGNLLVGTTTNTYVSRLVLNGGTDSNTIECVHSSTGNVYNVIFTNGNGAVGSIQTNGSSTSYVTSSDYRLKENIQPMQNALARNALLKPCTYSWKADGSTGEGFIAHELQAVCPDAVTGEKDAVYKDGKPVYQGVDTSFLVGHLVACIQELKAELDATKAEVAALKAK